MKELYLYSPVITTRLRYTASLLLEDLLGLKVQFTSDLDAFKKAEAPGITYTQQYAYKNSLWVPACGLLFETGIKKQSIKVVPDMELPDFLYRGVVTRSLPFFFQMQGEGYDLPFDLFSMCFYLVSRYEEYLPYEADDHGRFPAKESLAYQQDFLKLPLVNLWAMRLGEWLRHYFPTLNISHPQYRLLPTIDVDMAWSYEQKGLLRAGGAMGKALLQGRLDDLRQRWQVLTGKEQDPFNTFLYLAKAHQKAGAKAIYFFLLGQHGPYDKNIAPSNQKFQQLIRTIGENNLVGLHPSYGSNDKRERLFAERRILEKILDRAVVHSRQHYLRLHLPTTYQNLLEAGITDDYSMGYAAQPGFRASIATPFHWYDLPNEQITALRIHPFMVMDVGLKDYLRHTPDSATQQIKRLITISRTVGGQFCAIWHNSSFSAMDGWEGWQEVYDFLLREGRAR
ncbi:MAG: polysaccharide deacetylase family protein [Bacteroidota bacterium]